MRNIAAFGRKAMSPGAPSWRCSTIRSPHALLPEATHWFEQDGAIDNRAYYPNSILWSGTLVLDPEDPMPTYETIPAFLEDLARRRMAKRKKTG